MLVFGLFADSTNLDARLVHGLHRTYHTLRKSLLDTTDGSLGDIGLVEGCFSPFGDSISLRSRYVHGLRQTYHGLKNHFGRTRWYS
jgi:hypothetical protein